MRSKNAAITYIGDGIRAKSIHPARIDALRARDQDPAMAAVVITLTPMKRTVTPLKVPGVCLFLASDESSFITATEPSIEGGYLAQLPQF